MKYTKEQFLKAAELGEVSMIDAKHIVSLLDEVAQLPQQEISDEEAIEMLKDMNKQPMRFHCVPKEISDEDIEDVAWEKFITDSGRFGFISGAKWYREQLKCKKD
jgi:hypothetical protein